MKLARKEKEKRQMQFDKLRQNQANSQHNVTNARFLKFPLRLIRRTTIICKSMVVSFFSVVRRMNRSEGVLEANRHEDKKN